MLLVELSNEFFKQIIYRYNPFSLKKKKRERERERERERGCVCSYKDHPFE